MSKIVAKAVYESGWGAEEITLQASRSKRAGKPVTVYQWSSAGFLPFVSMDRALRAAEQHARISAVQIVEA